MKNIIQSWPMPSKGVETGKLLTTAVRFPSDIHELIRKRAENAGVSFATVVRGLVIKGLAL